MAMCPAHPLFLSLSPAHARLSVSSAPLAHSPLCSRTLAQARAHSRKPRTHSRKPAHTVRVHISFFFVKIVRSLAHNPLSHPRQACPHHPHRCAHFFFLAQIGRPLARIQLPTPSAP